MSIFSKFFVSLLAAVCASTVLATEPSVSTKPEVEHLLTRLAASGCKFQRNGTWYSGADARSHLEKKYQYLLDKHLVGSAEDFISMAATKSSMSGSPYLVKCGDRTQEPSAEWMEAQLRDVRAQAAIKRN